MRVVGDLNWSAVRRVTARWWHGLTEGPPLRTVPRRPAAPRRPNAPPASAEGLSGPGPLGTPGAWQATPPPAAAEGSVRLGDERVHGSAAARSGPGATGQTGHPSGPAGLWSAAARSYEALASRGGVSRPAIARSAAAQRARLGAQGKWLDRARAAVADFYGAQGAVDTGQGQADRPRGDASPEGTASQPPPGTAGSPPHAPLSDVPYDLGHGLDDAPRGGPRDPAAVGRRVGAWLRQVGPRHASGAAGRSAAAGMRVAGGWRGLRLTRRLARTGQRAGVLAGSAEAGGTEARAGQEPEGPEPAARRGPGDAGTPSGVDAPGTSGANAGTGTPEGIAVAAGPTGARALSAVPEDAASARGRSLAPPGVTALLAAATRRRGGGGPSGPRRRGTATSWAAALVLAFAVGLWAGGAAFSPPPSVPAAASGTAPATPAPVRILRSVPTTAKAIALTIDDGPSPKYTPMILQLMQQYGAHATFFVIGQEVERYPQILKQEVDAGDEIGNHGYHHLTLTNVTSEQLVSEVQTAEQTLVSLTGSDPTLYRLPGGKSDPAALRQLADLGYKIVMWSIDTRDYVYRSPAAIVAQVQKEVAPGAIVIFHDGGGNQQHTVDALKTLLPWLKEQGYQMMTVSQLLAMPRATVTH